MTSDCFKHHIKIEYQKITNFFVTTSDEIPRFFTKQCEKFMISQVVLMMDINQTNK